MLVKCRYVTYEKDKLCLGSLRIKVKRIYAAGSVNYSKKTRREIIALQEIVQLRS